MSLSPLILRSTSRMRPRSRRTSDRALLIGSVKANIGHLEGAAGIAGLIKVVPALQHQEIPSHLNLQRPSPHVPWVSIAIQVATALVPWPRGAGRRLAGVSSF